MKKVAIFASGSGSNFEVIAKDQSLKQLMSIEWLICDRLDAKVIDKARLLGISVVAFNPKQFLNKQSYEEMIYSIVRQCDYIFLAGYMRVISPYFLQKFTCPILNLHPSLLPKYKGKDAIKQAFDAGEEEIGISIHFVNEELDGGQVIAQRSLHRLKGENLEQLTMRIHALEHELYPKVIRQLLGEENEKSIN